MGPLMSKDQRLLLKDVKVCFNTCTLSHSGAQIDNWQEWLWPRPRTVHTSSGQKLNLPKDHKLKVYFDPISCVDAGDIMQIVSLCMPLLQPRSLNIELQRWWVAVAMNCKL
jgi:hypothetical protein